MRKVLSRVKQKALPKNWTAAKVTVVDHGKNPADGESAVSQSSVPS